MDDIPAAAAEVVEWVGDDFARAVAALDAEHDRPRPRKTVVAHCQAVVDAADPVVETETASMAHTVDAATVRVTRDGSVSWLGQLRRVRVGDEFPADRGFGAFLADCAPELVT